MNCVSGIETEHAIKKLQMDTHKFSKFMFKLNSESIYVLICLISSIKAVQVQEPSSAFHGFRFRKKTSHDCHLINNKLELHCGCIYKVPTDNAVSRVVDKTCLFY